MGRAQKSSSTGRTTRQNAAERIATELQRAIATGQLLPGEQIRQSDWANRLQASPVSLREALKILTTQYLLHHDPMRGYFVTRLDASQIDQLHQLRLLVEVELLKSIRFLTDEEFGQLETLSEQYLDQATSGNVDAANELTRQMSFMIWDLSPHDLFVREAQRLWHLADPYRRASIVMVRAIDPGLISQRAALSEYLDALARHDRDALIQVTVRDRTARVEYVSDIYGSNAPSAEPASDDVPSRSARDKRTRDKRTVRSSGVARRVALSESERASSASPRRKAADVPRRPSSPTTRGEKP